MRLEGPNKAIQPMNRQLLNNLTNWAFFLAGMANLSIGTWTAIQGDAVISATSLTAGIVLLFAATIDRFESLKGLGVEAKTRQLDKKIFQAEEALQRLRELTELTGTVLVDFNSKMGRIGISPSTRESISLVSDVRKMMNDIGSDEVVINKAMRPWARMLCFDMARALTKELTKLLREQRQAILLELENAKKNPIGKAEHSLLNDKLRAVDEFQDLRLHKFHLLQLEDYPEEFLRIFDDAPLIDEQTLNSMRSAASKYIPGMRELKNKQRISDPDLWIEKLERDKHK